MQVYAGNMKITISLACTENVQFPKRGEISIRMTNRNISGKRKVKYPESMIKVNLTSYNDFFFLPPIKNMISKHAQKQSPRQWFNTGLNGTPSVLWRVLGSLGLLILRPCSCKGGGAFTVFLTKPH